MTQMGQQGFRWWVGTVIDATNDPLKLGRVRVRVRGVDDFKEEDQITQWASCVTPTTSASYRGVGDTPSLIEGSEVFGFFGDGNRGEVRIIVGTIPQQSGDENTNALSFQARGKNPDELEKLHPIEPDSAFNAEYPFNRVIRTRKGHKIELDDTDGAERVHIYHASGTSIEMAPDGRLTIRNPGDSFELVGGIKNIAIKGDANIEVGGSLNARVKGATNIISDSSITVESKGILRLMGLLGVQISSGTSVTMQAPAGANVTEGSLHVIGRITSGTGLTTNIVAGGSNIGMRNGLVVRGG
ncbi:Protein Gp5, N-terminal OB-fold domain containing protein [uncultured Caudovirales phage]|uniref:Protein Gp5, N-terminal OB-fold domain containing protein n=1 Tax=uncultured Caudovirales phage TaxID=2100421 RepID=A0A6J5MBP7_9CAUD|nr:Protein Gp5, N-terminal OB-fold domain containing protein [uncultured Caudovirales phage]